MDRISKTLAFVSCCYVCVDEVWRCVWCVCCRSVQNVKQQLRRTVAAITWCVNDANTTTAGSV